ncbi:MAG: TIGR02444 family protein [Alphaproteobacteria bacterium]
MTAEADEFWRFSLRFYGLPEVQEICLRLQDEAGLNVNLILWCCWQAAQGRRLRDGDIANAAGRISGWSEDVTQPLRALRRRVKAAQGGDIALAARKQLYERLKAAELEAEKVEQALLCHKASAGTGTSGSRMLDLAKANLGAYMGSVDRPGSKRCREMPERLAHLLTGMCGPRG